MELKLIGEATLRKQLATWKPTTKLEAIGALCYISDILANEKHIKNVCDDFLISRCKDCDVYEAEGLTIRKVEVNKELYNEDTEEMVGISSSIKALTERYKELKEKNKTGVVQTTHYYKKI